MTNLEKYDKIFMEMLNVEQEKLAGLKYQDIQEWDSVGHISLIGELEEVFGIEIETDDLIDFSSYEHGKEIMAKYGVEI